MRRSAPEKPKVHHQSPGRARDPPRRLSGWSICQSLALAKSLTATGYRIRPSPQSPPPPEVGKSRMSGRSSSVIDKGICPMRSTSWPVPPTPGLAFVTASCWMQGLGSWFCRTAQGPRRYPCVRSPVRAPLLRGSSRDIGPRARTPPRLCAA